MLISMPTGTSTILGVFQVIASSQEIWRELHAEAEPRTTPDTAQVGKIEPRRGTDSRYFSLGQSDFSLGQCLGATRQSTQRLFQFRGLQAAYDRGSARIAAAFAITADNPENKFRQWARSICSIGSSNTGLARSRKYPAGQHVGGLQRHDVVGGQHAIEIGDETVGLAQPHAVERVADRARVGEQRLGLAQR